MMLTIKEICQAIIDDKELEVFNNNDFVPFKVGNSDHLHRFFNEYIEFRIKPKPVKVFGIEVEGISEPLKLNEVWWGDTYYYICVTNSFGFCQISFQNDKLDKALLNRGICWKSEEDIKKVVKALNLVDSNDS